MTKLVLILAMAAACVSCKKDNSNSGETVEVYLLKSYQLTAGKCEIDASSAVLEDAAIIQNQEILEYAKTSYQFKLADPAVQKTKALGDRTPFAVTVDKKVIYYGFFKPGYSSSSCDHSITMDLDWTTGNRISLKLGYPGPLQGVTIEDRRNNPVLLATLNKQGKLR
ncbi:hypothetical protein [Hymenobacter arizonensis]|uniref:Uncharacterized protein n=1 Tax=Hymenobacter arizonensis TaxID=1227077 RepID=A0A1I5VC48_HYMAR|nr:hypothetical protein [Hymenobacter arizonensis]SFQ05118.1 hypothetical protein SAMN04515668_1278 [Hymenobacter arizonensis]